MGAFVFDLRSGIRALWKRKGFSAAVVLTLALALGTTTTLYSVLSAVLLTPLPLDHPDELVLVWARNESLSRVRSPMSLPDFADLQREQTSFIDVAAMSLWQKGVTSRPVPRPARFLAVFIVSGEAAPPGLMRD